MIDQLLSVLASYETLFVWLGIGSLFLFLVSIALMPWLVSLIPVDYFRTHHEIHWHTLLTLRGALEADRGLCAMVAGCVERAARRLAHGSGGSRRVINTRLTPRGGCSSNLPSNSWTRDARSIRW